MKNTSRKVLVAFWIVCYLVTVICHHQQKKLCSWIVLYILRLPQEWGKCSAMGTPQALSPCPERSPRTPVCEGMEPGRQQNLDQAAVLHAARNIQPSSPPQRLFTSVVPAPFCHSHSSFIWAWWPSTKIWPRGNYKMENRSQASTNHSLANAFF